ncbi:MAG TPA: hypothetical protein VG711_07310, partial [Phycisphaerales bacterium]|nr:hypothetical protein [Phycisphaerales bacterium]
MATRIALATCRNLPEWERDDEALHEAFVKRGVEIARPAWDDMNVRWGEFNCVLIRTTWDYTTRVNAYVAWAERVEHESRLINPSAVVKWNVRKTYLKELAAQGVAIAETVWLEQSEKVDVAEVMERKGWERGFLKPVVGASAKGTMRFRTNEKELAAAQLHVEELLAKDGAMLQCYVPTVEDVGEFSAIFIDGEMTHSVRKIPMQGDYRVQNDHGGKDEPAELSAEEQATAKRIVKLVSEKFDGGVVYARVDFHREEYTGRMLLTELELVEPSLFFRHGKRAAERLAESVVEKALGIR